MSAALYGGLAALQLVGGYYSAKAIAESGRLNQDIAEMNAEFAELDAYDTELDGYSEQARYQSVVDQTLSDQTLAFAVNDVDVNFGTAADIQNETKFIAELNKMEIQKRAQEKSLGYESQARDFRVSGFTNNLQSQLRAGDAKFKAITGAISTGISGYGRS